MAAVILGYDSPTVANHDKPSDTEWSGTYSLRDVSSCLWFFPFASVETRCIRKSDGKCAMQL